MNKNLYYLILGLMLLSPAYFYPREADSIEVYLIDAYAKPEVPQTFILSYFTTDYCKSKVVIDDRYSYSVSDDFVDMHKKEIVLTDLNFNKKVVPFVIITEDEAGNVFTSEVFDFELPYEPEIEGGSSILQLCMFGAAIFLLPYPDMIIQKGESHFALTKDIPILSFRSSKGNYPAAYISLEYTYILNTEDNNFLRAGYKRIFKVDHIEYLAPGLSAYTNFTGNNGIGFEISAGLFTIGDAFTLYSRYRYNLQPGKSDSNFHELSIGLYSGFFSIYIK